MGECAELYRAFFPVMKPAELDALELWQIATLMGLDEAPALLQGPAVPSRPVPPQAAESGEVVSGPRLRAVR